jgi:hypothetical protein
MTVDSPAVLAEFLVSTPGGCVCLAAFTLPGPDFAKSAKAGDAKPGVYSRTGKLCRPGSPGSLAREKAKPVKTGDAKPKDLEPTGKQHWARPIRNLNPSEDASPVGLKITQTGNLGR